MLQDFRLWWQPPRKTVDRDMERRVTFLELFYDLVYVVVISQVSHALAGHVNRQGILEFAFLFLLVWIAWVNGTFYHELHGNNDIRTRVFTFAQMFTVAAMAVFAQDAFGAGGPGFALSFGAYQLILTYLWWRTGVYDTAHRPLSRPYVLTYLASAALFIISAFMPETRRATLWIAALILSVAAPVSTTLRTPTDPEVRAEQVRSAVATPSLVERFGLLIIIVLGEVIIGVVQGLAERRHLGYLDSVVFITAGLGMLLAIGLWWLYFDFVAQRMPKDGRQWTTFWMYLHLALSVGIVATGAMTLNVVEHAGTDLPAPVIGVLTGALALALVALALLMATIRLPQTHVPLYRRGGLVTIASAILCVGAGFFEMPGIPRLMLLDLFLLLPVLYGIIVWVRVLGAQELVLD